MQIKRTQNRQKKNRHEGIKQRQKQRKKKKLIINRYVCYHSEDLRRFLFASNESIFDLGWGSG